MAQLRVLLGGLACKFLSRQARRDRSAGVLPSAAAERRLQRHLQRCASCRRRQAHERQYLQRLRNAAVPEASGDLTARLLARTSEMAQQPEITRPGTAQPHAASPGAGTPAARPVAPAPARNARVRLAAAVTGGVAAATCLTAGTAYVLGEESGAAAGAPAFTDALTPPGTGRFVSAQMASVSGWRLSGEPDIAPAESLSAEQLSALRARGWACPEFRDLGYHLAWARAGAADGKDVLELRLTDGQSFATVLEQHPDPNGTAAGSGRGVPVNVLTGHPAPADGFVPVTLHATAADAAGHGAPGVLWVNRQPPYRAIYRTERATFTVVAEAPPAGTDDDGVAAALLPAQPSTAGPGADAAGAPAAESLQTRLGRGLQRVVELLAR
ncbi:hypothetical protein QWJ39_00610 [Arthrobacter sp. YD4]|uniref:hypothetical protein n=1 Tax=Arthrobacter sp. YD4 TaxID=3058043 RepID=UPI0025B4BF6E|nr:hypothetical protein [Arthrobacter sp. YD4]MDN3934811.1 hypothetical protein [Arthrobacter sp. YD4]